MKSVYFIEKDKYGEYFISYGKKRRLKTIDKNNIKYIRVGDFIIF